MRRCCPHLREQRKQLLGQPHPDLLPPPLPGRGKRSAAKSRAEVSVQEEAANPCVHVEAQFQQGKRWPQGKSGRCPQAPIVSPHLAQAAELAEEAEGDGG